MSNAVAYLLPCPFCGAEAVLRRRKTIWVECRSCQAIKWGKSESDAANLWNRRAAYAEVRSNRDGSLDEIVGQAPQFHLEQMSATHWWMEVVPDLHVNFHSKATIRAVVNDEREALKDRP